jgi:hypothetical protein
LALRKSNKHDTPPCTTAPPMRGGAVTSLVRVRMPWAALIQREQHMKVYNCPVFACVGSAILFETKWICG